MLEREELALPHARVERRCEERFPLRVERREQRLNLVRPNVVEQTLHDLPLRHVSHRVRADELLHPAGHREGPAEVATQVVDAPRAETVLLLREEEVHLSRRDLDEPQIAERRPDDVLTDARLARVRSPNPAETGGAATSEADGRSRG